MTRFWLFLSFVGVVMCVRSAEPDLSVVNSRGRDPGPFGPNPASAPSSPQSAGAPARNPALYTPEEFSRRRRDGNPFLKQVLAGETIILIGKLPDEAE